MGRPSNGYSARFEKAEKNFTNEVCGQGLTTNTKERKREKFNHNDNKGTSVESDREGMSIAS